MTPTMSNINPILAVVIILTFIFLLLYINLFYIYFIIRRIRYNPDMKINELKEAERIKISLLKYIYKTSKGRYVAIPEVSPPCSIG